MRSSKGSLERSSSMLNIKVVAATAASGREKQQHWLRASSSRLKKEAQHRLGVGRWRRGKQQGAVREERSSSKGRRRAVVWVQRRI